MASGLSRRVSTIETSIALLSHLGDRLRYLQQPMGPLIESLSQLSQFADIRWLIQCRELMGSGLPFPLSWREAVSQQEKQLGTEVAEVLLPLGDVLGATDLDSQSAALEHACLVLEDRLEAARAYRLRHAGLYRSMGALCGIAIAIILI